MKDSNAWDTANTPPMLCGLLPVPATISEHAVSHPDYLHYSTSMLTAMRRVIMNKICKASTIPIKY